MPVPDVSGSDWFQWVMGGWAALSLGVAAHLYSRIEEVKDLGQDRNHNGLKEVWQAIDGLRKDMVEDRKIRAEERVLLASQVVTRAELRSEIDRVIHVLNRHQREGRNDA